MELKLQEFAQLAVDADSALFFYAGNALHFQDRDFLMPTNAMLEDEISVRYELIGLDVVENALDRSNGVKIIIIDAFRNNPFAKSHSAAPRRDDFPYIDKSKGRVIAFASAPDDVAQDGQGRNSPFTAALLKRLQEPGLEIGVLFRRVGVDVNAQTGGRQRPETTISLRSEYYLHPRRGQ